MNRKAAQLLQMKEDYQPHEIPQLFEKAWEETKKEMIKSLPDINTAEQLFAKQINDENYLHIGEYLKQSYDAVTLL